MSSIPIDILLTDIHTLRPVLGPLSGSSTDRAPQPEQLAASSLAVPGNSSDLVLEKWGVVVPQSAAGEKMLAWIRPLLELRKEQCGLGSSDEVPLLRVAPGLDRQGARSWRTEYERIPPDSRPGYLLILGDLHEVSHDLQQELMVCASVGRLCFTTPDGQPDREGYQSYCEKVRDVEGTLDDWNHRARLLFYASHDGTQALQDGYLDLIRSCYQEAEHDAALALEGLHLFGRIDDHQWHTSETDTAAQKRTLLDAAEMREPAVLLSVTHGLGVKDAAEQAQRQGSLVLREAGGRRRREVLGPEYFFRPFLPRGFWFLHACFGAGTPATSAYQHWLEILHRSNLQGEDPREALGYLARDKSRPFIARVPQVALANPDGPLGVLGHLDLAWTYGFQGADEADPSQVYAEHDPYYGVLRMVALGERFGPAVASLGEKTLALGTQLATLYGDAEARGVADDEHRTLRARLWMRYLDLAGYILLGDPAARLPTTAARAIAGRGVDPPVSGPSARLMQEAVMEVLRQKKPPRQIAADAGVRPATLDRWVATFLAGGRNALASLGSQPAGRSRGKKS